MRRRKLEQDIGRTKKIYESTEIPEELDQAVRKALRQGTGRQGERKAVPMRRRTHYGRTAAAAAAALMVCFITGLNTSEAFAATAKQLPIIGAVSRVLTFRNYDIADGEKAIHVEIPEIQEESGNETSGRLADGVNREIEKIMEEYKAEAEKRIAEYKEAFLATGGTEAEFAEKGIKVDAGYEVKYETEDILSLEVTANENWTSAYGIRYFYNLDLKNGKKITLEDLLGRDFVNRANQSIRTQMEERMAQNQNLVYWDGSNGIDGFRTVGETTKFYIGRSGNPVIVFDKYEIAPGAFGAQEFEIARE